MSAVDDAKEAIRQTYLKELTRPCVKCGKLVVPPDDAPLWALLLVDAVTRIAPGGLQCRECAELE